VLLWNAVCEASALQEVVLPRVLEALECISWEIRLWRLVVHVDRLRSREDPLRCVRLSSGLCLQGAAWWAGCRVVGEALLFSGCAGGAGPREARPLMAMA
jgi:hypothetical protein